MPRRGLDREPGMGLRTGLRREKPPVGKPAAERWGQRRPRFPGASHPTRTAASRPVIRVLLKAIIYLGCQSPDISSDLPEGEAGHLTFPPARSCSGWGLPSRPVTWPLVSSYLTVSALPA